MSDNDAGTTTQDEQAQAADAAAKAAAGTGTVTAPDEVTTLRSRNAGLDAKITALTLASKEANGKAADALAKLAAYEQGKVGADEALRAQLQAKSDELNAARSDAALAKIEAKYPETFKVYGAATATMTAAQLADGEARFRGVGAEEETTVRPHGNNPARTQGGASGAQTNPEGETLEQMQKRVFAMDPRV